MKSISLYPGVITMYINSFFNSQSLFFLIGVDVFQDDNILVNFIVFEGLSLKKNILYFRCT